MAVSLLVGAMAWLGVAFAQTPDQPPATPASEQTEQSQSAGEQDAESSASEAADERPAGLPTPVQAQTLQPAPRYAGAVHSPPPRYVPPSATAASAGAPPAGPSAPPVTGAPATILPASQQTPPATPETPAEAEPVAPRPAPTGVPAAPIGEPTQPAAPNPAPAQPLSSAAVEPAGYILGPNDRLRLIVFGEENLSGEFAVDATGRIALPLVGEVVAAGLDVRAFERAIERRLADGYLRDPQVSVEVLTARPFYILGEVQNPGQYPYIPGMTAPNAVATAGGFAPLADQGRVFIKRAAAPDEQEFPLGPATLVQPGDTIRIAKGAFYILGEVNQAGEYPYSDNLTVMQAVATAKGFTYRANRGRVFIRRAGEAEERSYKLTPTLRLQPGDTIRVGERFF